MIRENIRPGTRALRLTHLQKCIYKATNSTRTSVKHSVDHGTTQRVPKDHLTCHNEDNPKYLHPIFNLLLYIALFIIVLTLPAIHYHIKTASILWIFRQIDGYH